MTTNNFGDLAAERDRELSIALYHNVSLMRRGFHGWIVEELKELGLEADRLFPLVSTVQQGRLVRLKEKLKEIADTNQHKVSVEDTVAMQDANDGNWGHVYEPTSKMLAELMELAQIMAGLKECRDKIEAIPESVNP